MAERMIKVCDLEPGLVPAEAHVVVDVDGGRQELDLCADHLRQLRELLALTAPGQVPRQRGAGDRAVRSRMAPRQPRKRAAAKTRGRRTARAAARQDRARSWAREHGFVVKDRGRLPAEVVRAFEAAKPGGKGA